MDENNPYQTPAASLETKKASGPLHEPHGVPIPHGATWFSAGFRLFTAAPGPWIGIVLLLLLAGIATSLIPLAQFVLYLFYPVVMGGVMLGCRGLERGERLTVGHMFTCFSNPGKLIMIGVISTAGSLVAMVGGYIAVTMMDDSGVGKAMLQSFMGLTPDFRGINPEDLMRSMAIMMLVYFGILLPVIAAIWFAPALISLHDVDLPTALRMSFMACLKNILPFLIYSIVITIAFILGAIPLLLGLLVVVPAMYASIYMSYRDIFVD